jgi:translocation and assembly module TamB
MGIMALRLPDILSKCVASRWRLFLTLLALFFVLILLLLLAAPTLLSSNLAQNQLKATLSTTLHGPVDWSSLQLSWTRGLQLHNLTVGPTTGALRQARLAEIDCRPGFGFGAKSGASFGLDLFLRLDDLQLELAPPASPAPPPVPTEEKVDPLTALAQGLDRFASLSWPLPIDLRVDVAVAPITLSYHDPGSGHRLRYAEGDLQFKMPSLEQSPLTFSLNGKMAVDEHPLGALRLATEMTGLVSPSGRLVPAGALLSTVVDFPGLMLKADGRLDQEQGLQGELNLDLPQLQKIVVPFLPSTLPQMGGTLLATLHATVDKEQDLALSCTLAGRKLSGDKVGPIDFDLGQQIKADHRRQLVTLGGGVLMIPQFLEANWEARVEEPSSPERRVSAQLHQLKIDLDPALALAAPFLPPGLPQLSGGQLRLRDLDLQLHGAEGEGELRLANATVTLQSVRLRELTVSGIDLATSDLDIPLSAYFPASVTAGIEWKIAAIDLNGAQPLALSGVAGSGNLAIAALRKGEGEGRFSANGRFDHQLRLKSAEATGLAQLRTLANDLHLAFALQPDGGIRVETLEFNTAIATLTATLAGKELPSLPLRQTLQVAGVTLRPGESLPAIKSVTFSVDSPAAFNVSVAGNLTAERLLTLNTQSRLELPRLIALAGPLLPEKLAASGVISNELQLVATLPDRPLPTGQTPLRSAKNALALLQELSGTLQLDGVELHLPLANGSLHLSGITTPQPFSLRSSNHGEKIDLAGALVFDLRAGSSINGKLLPAEHGQITCNGELRDWDRAFLAESVEIAPLGLAERSELTLAGLASFLDQPLPPSPATLLQRLDATLFSEIGLNLRTDAPQLLPDLNVTGKTLAGSRIDLRGGESLRLHAYVDAENLNVNIANGPQLQGLQAHFLLDRTLQIRSAMTARAPWLPLSTSLVQPLPPPLPPPLAEERERLHDDLRGNSGGERSLSLQALTLSGLPLPLTISALEAEIATGQAEAGMNFLQLDLLGGTLRARALLDLRPLVPVLSAEALFTNLDLDRLVSGDARLRPGAEESSISGEGFLRVPLLDERRAFLEGLTLSARLRHIGAKSFDRALVSLDPHETNEAIMAQRKLLRLGRLQRAEVEVSDGALSLSGAVNVEDVTIDLPKIDRLRLADLPLHKELAPLLTAISAVRPPLEFVRADILDIGAQGEISLRKEEK